MKKIICAVALVLALVPTLASCGKFTCDLCGEEKSGKKYEFELLGEEGVCCEECHDEIEALQNALQ